MLQLNAVSTDCDVNMSAAQSVIVEKKRLYEKAQNELSRLKKELSASLTKAKDLEETGDQKEKQISKLEQESQDKDHNYQQQLEEKDNLLKNKEFELKYANDNLNEVKEKLVSLEEQAQALQEAKQKADKEASDAKHRLETLQGVRFEVSLVMLCLFVSLRVYLFARCTWLYSPSLSGD